MTVHGRYLVCPNVGCLAVQIERPQCGSEIGEAAGSRRPNPVCQVSPKRPDAQAGLFWGFVPGKQPFVANGTRPQAAAGDRRLSGQLAERSLGIATRAGRRCINTS